MSETTIWTKAGFVPNDPWQVVDAQDELPAEGDVLVPLEAFVALSDEARHAIGAASGRNTRRIGVVIAPDDEPETIADMLDDIALVAVEFPKFSDGRAFSHAARLREQLGFKGEIRAIGDVLIDQIPLMLRVGIDSFAVSNEVTRKRLADGRLTGLSLHYQPTALAAREAGTYAWRRASA
jgi:uncharacterized protein (DUF934 family)